VGEFIVAPVAEAIASAPAPTIAAEGAAPAPTTGWLKGTFKQPQVPYRFDVHIRVPPAIAYALPTPVQITSDSFIGEEEDQELLALV
jgi:hypothetical protein